MGSSPEQNGNPLLLPFTLPNGAPPFDQVKTAHFAPALDAAIAEARAEIDAIKNDKTPASFNNTIEALEFTGKKMSRVLGVFSHLASANTDDEILALKDALYLKAVQFDNDVLMDGALFTRIKAAYEASKKTPLDDEQSMLLSETYNRFVRKGALLDDGGKNRLREIEERLSELSNSYSKNKLKSADAYQKVISDEAALAGVPERAKNIYRETAKEKGQDGKFVIALSPPPVDILEYGENRALREEIYRANTNVAYGGGEFDNSANVLEFVKLRHEKAGLLGFKTYAAYVLDDRMAKTPGAVMDFLRKNEKVYRPAAEAYVKKVRDYAEKTDGLKDLKPWDFSYYSRRLEEETFQVSMEEVRPYLDLEKVLNGLREHAEKLFKIEMKEIQGKYPVYHPDVKVYEVFDKKNGEMIGLFYADYYARPGAKSSGAWMDSLRTRGLEDGENKFSIVMNVCNFAKPTESQPTLLSLDEVRTVFHEFGHGLHSLLARGTYPSLNGTNVKWDFVELPSQLQENWAKRKEVLDTFAKHYKTGEQLPAELIKKLNDAENFSAGYFGLRQTFLALLDMTWHNTDPKALTSVESVEDALIAQSWLFPRVAGPMSTNFGHIFSGGYASGYYSYKWAEVLDASAFMPFASKGLYDDETGEKIRIIYESGGRTDPMEVFIKAMGEAPNPDALFIREGLIPPQEQV